jgi:hypothetical protein
MASEMLKFNIFTTKICKTIYCKYNVTIAERTVAHPESNDITSEFCVFTKIYTNILRAKQNKSTVIGTFHRKIDIVVE